MTRKLILHDGRSVREIVLVGTLTVGRDPACHISDLDPLLSRRHAEFVLTKAGCTVRDLGSRNGMLVNGLKVREQLLQEGDLVQLGHLQMRYTEDHLSPQAERQSHATTAHEAATVAVAAAPPPAALEDTRPHPPHLHAHADADATRLTAGTENEEPTMAPKGKATADTDVTIARRAAAPAADADVTMARSSVMADPDATFVAGSRPVPAAAPALPNTDLDVTSIGRRAPASVPPADLDATIAPGSLDLDATIAPRSLDLDATIAPRSVDLDATIAPGSLDLDATFAPGSRTAHATAMPPMEARLTANADLVITAATPGCRAHFNAAPNTLIGRPLGEVLAERLSRAAADGPSELTLAVDRSPADRSLIVILKAVQVETVS